MAHPYEKYREYHPGRARVKRILKADGGSVKDQTRYGDAAADVTDNSRPNQWEACMLQGPPRTKNTPGFDTETSSTRQKKGQS